MADLGEFAKRMTVVSEKVGKGATKVLRKAALAVDQAVVFGTPVDTGRARSNWVVSINIPVEGTREPYKAGKNLGRDEVQNLSAALEQGMGVIGKAKIKDTIIIGNNLPYIQRLNDGHSAQSPANFVEDAIKEAVKAVKSVKILEGGE